MSTPSGPGVGKQVLTLLTGTTMVQALGILVSPIVARQYGPTALGHLTAAGVFASMIATIASLALDAAIVIVDKDDEASEIGGFVVTSSVAVGLISVGFVMLVSGLGASWESLEFVNTNSVFWACFVGAMTVLTCSTAAISSLAVRYQQFSSVSSSRVVQSVVTQGLTLGLGVWAPSDLGAASALLAGQTLGLGVLLMTASKAAHLTRPSVAGMKRILSTHRRFPLYTYPQAIFDSLRENAIIVAVGMAGGPTGLGHWALVSRTVRGPAVLLGGAFGQVVSARASERVRCDRPLLPLVRWVGRAVGLPSLLAVVLLVVAGPQVFAAVFGSEWSRAGHLARLVSPLIAMNMLVAPFGQLPYLLKVNRAFLGWGLVYNGLLVSSCFIAPRVLGFDMVVVLISAVGVFVMTGVLIWLVRTVHQYDACLVAKRAPKENS
ncbi:MAG: lipopolysaccharide biosynthesis protein [Archangiaceae bacterium]|nr:lipopolysaccharide biosynthesis protein [Archangiaceae bacterium]